MDIFKEIRKVCMRDGEDLAENNDFIQWCQFDSIFYLKTFFKLMRELLKRELYFIEGIVFEFCLIDSFVNRFSERQYFGVEMDRFALAWYVDV